MVFVRQLSHDQSKREKYIVKAGSSIHSIFPQRQVPRSDCRVLAGSQALDLHYVYLLPLLI